MIEDLLEEPISLRERQEMLTLLQANLGITETGLAVPFEDLLALAGTRALRSQVASAVTEGIHRLYDEEPRHFSVTQFEIRILGAARAVIENACEWPRIVLVAFAQVAGLIDGS